MNATGRVRSSIGSAGTAMLFAVTGAVLFGALRVGPQQPTAASDADGEASELRDTEDRVGTCRRATRASISEARAEMSPRRATPQTSEPLSPEAESLRRARVSAWEWEGGGLGPRPMPLGRAPRSCSTA